MWGDGHGGHSGTTISVPDPWVEDETSGGRERMWGGLQARFGGSLFLNEDARGHKAGMGKRRPWNSPGKNTGVGCPSLP